MRDVFVSYAREDRDRVEPFVEFLEGSGLSVWWDSHIRPGAGFDDEIQAALDAARVVVVLWSNASIASHWVKEEAREGLRREVLVPVCIDAVEPPLGFRSRQHIDAVDGRYEAVVDAVRGLLDPEDSPALAPTSQGASAAAVSKSASSRMLLIGGVTAAFALALLVLLAVGMPIRDEDAGEPTASDGSPPAATGTSIAVLPFVALSTNVGDGYFGRGLAEELLNALGRIDDLDVAARTSAFSFDGAEADVGEIGERLGVDYVVQGSVRRSGDQLRITTQLVRTSDGFNLWSETYQRTSQDVFDIEDDIVRKLAHALQVRLGVGDFADRISSEGIDPRAYEDYLRGLTIYGDRLQEDDAATRAQAAIRAALDREPDFGAAWATLATIGLGAAGSPLSRDPEGYVRQTDEAFARALELRPRDGDTHALYGAWLAREKLDFEGAERHLDIAASLSGSSQAKLAASIQVLRMVGDVDATSATYERAMRLDPLNNGLINSRAHFLVQVGNHEEAFELFERCFENRCMQVGGFLPFTMAYVAYTGDEGMIDRWQPRYEAFEAVLPSVPPSMKPRIAEILPTLMSIMLERRVASGEIEALVERFRVDPILEYVGLWGPLLADVLPEDLYFDSLETMHREGLFFSHGHALDPFYGVNPYPDWVRRHPRYRAIWNAPGMRELAQARRRNGWTDGLPLPP